MNYVQRVETVVTKLLTKMPPELAVDVIDKGLLLSGGMASIDMIENYFIEKLGVPVFVVDSPNQAVISGIGTAFLSKVINLTIPSVCSTFKKSGTLTLTKI